LKILVKLVRAKPIKYALIALFFFSSMIIPSGLDSLIKVMDERGFIVEIGDISPDFSMEYLDGSIKNLSDYRGQIVMLQFTASWCSVCRKEMPHIENEVWQAFKDKGLVVIGIDRDEPKDVVEKFSEEMNITYPLVLDPGAEIFGLYAGKESGITRNIVLDREGKIVFLTRLFDQTEFNAMVKKIGELIVDSKKQEDEKALRNSQWDK